MSLRCATVHYLVFLLELILMMGNKSFPLIFSSKNGTFRLVVGGLRERERMEPKLLNELYNSVMKI